jgi:hypothetical protein
VVVAQNFVISGANALSFRGENNAVANANVEYTIAIWGGQLTNTIGRPRFNFAGVGLFRSVIDADGPLTYWWLTTAAGAGANAAPAGRNNAIAMLENTNYTFTLADFGFADLMDTEPDDFSFVVISSLPENGTLKLDGQDVEVNQSIDVDEIIANQLVFTPQTNSTGAPYDAFAFRVGDSGGTTDGSVDTDPLAKTMTMNVVDSNSVSHAPSGLSKTVSTWLSVPIVFALDDFGFADTSDSPANNPQSVKIATLPSSGLLTSSGIPVEVGSFVGVDQINEGKLLYWPPTDEAGDGIDSLTFQVRDDGGTFNNGEDTDLTARTITFDILDTAAQDTQYSTLKNETLTVLANDGLLRFAYAASGEDMTVTKVNGLTSNVGTGVSTGHGTLTVQSTGAFTFVPTTGFTGDVTFDYTVDDGYDESTATVTIHVVKVLAHDGGTSILHDHGGDAPGTVWADWLVSLADDADGDPDDLTIVAIDGLESNVGVETPTAMGGSVTVESDGSFTYNPRPNWKGDDWFAFTVSDEDDNTSTAFFLISVTNTPPVLEDQEYETGENETFEAPGTGWASGLLGGASDEDDDEIFIYAVQGETTNLGSATQTDQGGSVTVEEDGSWVYTPPLNWTGDDTFTVTAWDGCDFITVTITIHVG